MKKLRIALLTTILIGTVAMTGFFLYGQSVPELPYSSFVMSPLDTLTTKTIQLIDGRTLAFEEYGRPTGIPVFYFHGGQESRLSAAFMNEQAKKLGLRIISPDRPGIGLSTFQKDRSLTDYPSDIIQLADSLNIGTFRVIGLSGGGPHALACAHALPHRVLKVAIVSGAAPYSYKGKLKGAWFPIKLVHWFAASDNDKNLRGFMEREQKTILEKPQKRLKQLQLYLPKPDRQLLREYPDYGIGFIKGSQEAFRQGIEAVVQEWKLYVRDWGFELEEIQQPVTLWYGASDKMTPVYRGRYLHGVLPNSSLLIREDQGYFSLIRNHLDEILRDLKE